MTIEIIETDFRRKVVQSPSVAWGLMVELSRRLRQADGTIGSLVLPFPSGITQDFSNLKFTCPGGLLSALLPASSGYKRLQYWQGQTLRGQR